MRRPWPSCVTGSPSDLRVVPAAALCWAAAAALTRADARWSCLVVALGLVGVLVGRRRPGLTLTALCLLVVAAGCGWRVAALDASPLGAAAERGRPVELEAQVRQDGRAFAGAAGPGVVVPVTVRSLVDGERRWRIRVRATAFLPETPRPPVTGTRLWMRADPAPSRRPDEAATLRVLTWREQGVGPWWWRWSEAVRDGIRDGVDHHDDPAAALVPALVAGDESGLDEQTREDFRRTGLTHLLAVSGANLTILLGVVLLGLRSLGASRGVLLGAGGIGVVAFVLVARPEPSVLRAAVMGVVALGGLATGRSRTGLRALAWAVVTLLVIDPWLATTAGFVLSVCATAGIVVGASPLAARLCWLPTPLATAVAVPLVAQLACLPMVTALSGEISLVAVLANLVAGPAVAPATVAGLLAGVIDLGSARLAAVIGSVAWAAALVIVTVARIGADLPGAAIGWPHPWWTTLPVVAGCAGALWRLGHRPGLMLGLVLGLSLAVVRPPSPGWPPDGVLVVACDVGQGDGLVLPTGPGRAVVVDVGERPEPIDRCLRDLGVERIDLLLFTHADLDHVGGRRGAARGRRIDTVALGPSGGPPVRAARRVDLRAGDRVRAGGLELEVLWPPPGAPTTASRNDQSVVVMASVRGRRILLTGDLGAEAQRALARRHPDLAADVLKVPHHGSADHWPGLVDRVRPSVALIGVGEDNRFGHPAPALLETLQSRGVPVWRTDRAGTVAVVVRDDGTLAVSSR